MRRYHDELRYDLWERGYDLLDLWRGTLSPSLLEAIISHLPRSSAYVTAFYPEGWDANSYILADIYDALERRRWEAHGMAELEPYDRYPRPGQRKREQTATEKKTAYARAQRERQRKRAAERGDHYE